MLPVISRHQGRLNGCWLSAVRCMLICDTWERGHPALDAFVLILPRHGADVNRLAFTACFTLHVALLAPMLHFATP